MATVVIAASAVADLDVLIVTHQLPATTRRRVRASLARLSRYPLLGRALTGRWRAFRFIVGPWAWLLVVYLYDEAADEVAVVTIQDARSARAATGSR